MIEYITLWPHVHECVICGAECDGSKGLPMYEEFVLPNNWEGEWGGFMACDTCFALNDDPPEPRLPIKPEPYTLEGCPT